MKLKATIPNYNTENLEKTVKELYNSYIDLIGRMDHMLRHLEDENIDDISANKITAGTITATVEMLSAIITGGLIRTAKDGKRLELIGNRIRCFNSSNKKQGFNIKDETSENYGDVGFYIDDNEALTIHNAINGFEIKPNDGYSLVVGSDNYNSTYLKGIQSRCVLEAQILPPTNEANKIKLYYDGTDLKAVLPDGTTKTVTMG
jgi:hypothetical protein